MFKNKPYCLLPALISFMVIISSRLCSIIGKLIFFVDDLTDISVSKIYLSILTLIALLRSNLEKKNYFEVSITKYEGCIRSNWS